MPLSWNEIKTRAAAFITEWKDETNEHAEAKTFWDEFFHIFDIKRRRLASFEYHVKKINNKNGYVDLFWPGNLIVEHKSLGRNLDKAHGQVLDYFHGIADRDLPKYILVSDFANFRLYDLDNETQADFPITDLLNHIQEFGFIAGYQKRTFKEQDPVNIEAAEIMGQLHDKLKAVGYTGHALELYLVRLLFCLFADDTTIWDKGIFHEYIDLKTAEDGSDLARAIAEIFQLLNTPEKNRLQNLDESLADFPYVNGKLFEEQLPFASFDSSMRQTLLDCCGLDWGKISPAIFGSLFQSVMDEKARRNLGAHYTSEKNILKLIKPLFLDDLYDEFEKVKKNKAQLQKLHDKISNLRFLDPACGCGNFLIIAYRELRLLEIDIIKQLLKLQGYREEVLKGAKMDAAYLIKCNVDQFYGIEYEEFPAQIALTAMWLMDHQMNMLVTDAFGEYFVRLPLQKAATIAHGNALRIDWQSLLNKDSTVSIYAEKANIILNEPEEIYKVVNVFAKEVEFKKKEELDPQSSVQYDFILGNPPFVGSKWMSDSQREDMAIVAKPGLKYGLLDYVTGWYVKAYEYLRYNNKAQIAFVSTNSITQGEQVFPLWSFLIENGVEINFAYRTFIWTNEAKAAAAVHCVIIGFGLNSKSNKKIFIQEDKEIIVIDAKNINPYLFDAKSILIPNRSKPICNVPEIATGNKPIDDGNYIFLEEEKERFIQLEPISEKYIFPFLGAEEFINNKKRFILYLKNAKPEELQKMPFVLERIKLVKEFRERSKSKPTQKLALTPTLYHTENVPQKSFLVIPQVSSVRRRYIPIGYLNPIIICSDKLRIFQNAKHFDFGVLTSEMHMSWMRTITGRLKSDFQYSVLNVYNNYPWPETPTDKQKEAVENAAQQVLDVRASFPKSSLADLYDPNTMPPVLLKAHQQLDKAVDQCYRSQPFTSEAKRIEFLFELYDKYTSGLFVKEKKTRKKRT